MQVVLVMFRADGERRSFSLPRTVTVIGRREDCDLRIPLGDVSRKHCRFIADNDTLKIEDLGSSNGTFHNGVRIQEAIVNAGDNVQVGPVMASQHNRLLKGVRGIRGINSVDNQLDVSAQPGSVGRQNSFTRGGRATASSRPQASAPLCPPGITTSITQI